MKITCESCGGEDWQITYYERKGPNPSYIRNKVVYTALKCTKCSRIFPLANLSHGLNMYSAEHAREFLKKTEIGQQETTFIGHWEEFAKYQKRLQGLPLKRLADLDADTIKTMHQMGIRTLADLAAEDPKELSEILDFPQEEIEDWIRKAREATSKSDDEEK